MEMLINNHRWQHKFPLDRQENSLPSCFAYDSKRLHFGSFASIYIYFNMVEKYNLFLKYLLEELKIIAKVINNNHSKNVRINFKC